MCRTDDKPFLLRTKLGIHDCGIGTYHFQMNAILNGTMLQLHQAWKQSCMKQIYVHPALLCPCRQSRSHLTIIECAGSDLDDADNIDIVSKNADPNGMLHKRGTDLEPRAKDKFTSPNSKQLDIIKQAIKIAFPNDFHTIDSLKQARTTFTVFRRSVSFKVMSVHSVPGRAAESTP